LRAARLLPEWCNKIVSLDYPEGVEMKSGFDSRAVLENAS